MTHTKHYHMTAWPCDKIPPRPRAIKAKFGLDLITCTPRDKITLFTTQANHFIILEFAHLKFQRFLRPLPPLYITKHPLKDPSHPQGFARIE